MPAPKDPIKNAEWHRRMSEARRGEKHPQYGLRGKDAINYGKHFTEEHCKRIGDAQRGEKNHFFGKHRSEEWKKEHSKKVKGNHHTEEAREKISKANLGKKYSEKTRKKISEAKKGIRVHSEEMKKKIGDMHRGDKSPNWKGGVSFEPYCSKFSREFKERVRSFFGYCCPECGSPENGRKLHVHHINYNKMVCCDETPPLFIPLCISCHTATNSNRNQWEQHFTKMIEQYYGGKSYFTKEEMSALNQVISC